MFPEILPWKFRLPSKKLFALFLVLAGLSLVASALLPVGHYYVRLTLQPRRLIDPSDTSGNLPRIITPFGFSAVDYSMPVNWFPDTPPAPVDTKISYFTVSLPGINLTDIPVEINGSDLKKNAIHYPGTPLPGQPGNVVIFGHSALPALYRPGSPLTIFNPLLRAEEGQDITVGFDGITYHYRIKEIREVKPSQVEVLAQRYDKNEITLITCVPLGTYWRRLVVRAELVN